MSFFVYPKQIYLKSLAGLSIAILFIILFFGLRPKDFTFSNNVNWIADQPGIQFSKYGIAYTKDFIESSGNNFSIVIALKPLSYGEDGFNLILTLDNGKDSDQLIIGQWRSWIIIMNGDDYAHKRGAKRLTINIASPTPIKRLITVTTGLEGSRAYMDGHLVHAEKDLVLKIPDGDNTRLLLGNSVYGKHSWKGDIYGLAFFKRTLTDDDALRHFNAWSKNQNFSFAKESIPVVLYEFDGENDLKVFDHSGGNLHLEIPMRMQILKKDILSWKWSRLTFNKNLIQDMIINFIGFMPFGFFLFAFFGKLGGVFEKHDLLLTIGIGFMVSLMIEIVQAWMPSRSSQLIDLMLNTLGTCLGAFIYKFFFGHNRHASVCKY